MLAKMFVAGTVMLAGPLMEESLAPVYGDSFFIKTAQAASEHEIVKSKFVCKLPSGISGLEVVRGGPEVFDPGRRPRMG